MHCTHQLLLEEPIRMASILEPSKDIMLDTVGPELQVINTSEKSILLQEVCIVVLTPDQGQEASSEVLPINFSGISKSVKKGDTIFVGQYLFTGSGSTSVWLEVDEVKGEDGVCVIKNTATVSGSLFTLHACQVHIDLPTLSDKDKEVISTWGSKNKIDFLSLSFTRHAEDVHETSGVKEWILIAFLQIFSAAIATASD